MASNHSMMAATVCDDGIDLTEPAVALKSAAPPLRADNWSARKTAREIHRTLRRPMHFTAAPPVSSSFDSRRLEPPHNLFDAVGPAPTPSITPAEPTVTSAVQLQVRRKGGGQILSWLIVVVGGLTLLSGIGLVGWSLYANEMMYWNLALGLSLGGQGALILGLVLVVSRLWRNSRFATSKLQEVHVRLGQLQQTADVLTTMRSGASGFYADLARGASPQILLGNLKGQLDQLAARVGNF